MTRVEPTIEDKIRALPDLMELEGAEELLVAENRMTPRLRSIIELRKRELKQALVVLACLLAMPADAAFGETTYIGRRFINGAPIVPSSVTIAPSEVPGQLAVVTFINEHVNQEEDDGTRIIATPDVTVSVRFTFDFNSFTGADRIDVKPPAGVTCDPTDCGITVLEGFTGRVVLFQWQGM